MLTDIFAYRYEKRPIWTVVGEAETRLLNQAFRIIAEQLFPRGESAATKAARQARWKELHDALGMELGLDHLSPPFYSNGQQSWAYSLDLVCRGFVCALYGGQDPDRFMKERISFVELAFRARAEEIQKINAELPARIIEAQLAALRPARGIRLPGSVEDGMRAWNAGLNDVFQSAVQELNERLRRAGAPLSYHNGFIQVTTDALTEDEVASPFWSVVADPVWKNVDIDMKEAFDRRESNDRDPAWYAARALESAIKIISDSKGWTHGNEKGAHSYIDNLGATKNGNFIKAWERDALKRFFTEIRAPFGHGPGSAEMPELTLPETTWAIETCMSWVKSLIQRL
jgi:hypothetical protein